MRGRRRFGLIVAVGCVLLWSEAVHARAVHRRLGGSPRGAGTGEVVVALGCRNRGPRANLLNRFRVRAAIRSLAPDAGPSRLLLCGGAVGGATPEAELMAAYARTTCGYRGELLLETTSRTTWQNIEHAIPLIERADRIKIVSNPLHAEQARAYLWRQRPDLAQRLVAAEEYRFGELVLLGPLLAVHGLRNLRRHDRGRSRAIGSSS